MSVFSINILSLSIILTDEGWEEIATGGRFPRARLLPLPSLRSVQWLQLALVPQESPPFALSTMIYVNENPIQVNLVLFLQKSIKL